MRLAVCAIGAIIALAVQPTLAQTGQDAAGAEAFWKGVQAKCDATAAKPAGVLGRRIAQNAIDEFARFGGHEVDSIGRLFHFGQTEAEHAAEHGGDRPTQLGELGWWRVMTYWRALYGKDVADYLEVRGYQGASTSEDAAQTVTLVRPDVAKLLHDADSVSDPDEREVLRETVLRAAIIDTPWSAAFVSYVIRQAGATADQFLFSNAHRVYIYDAFATSSAELTGKAGKRLYRACPPAATRPRAGDLICFQREPALESASGREVRERVRAELAGGKDTRTVRRTHCSVVAHIDKAARKMYVIGGNLQQGVSVSKLNLRRNMKFSPMQSGHCPGPGDWTLPKASPGTPPVPARQDCSLNDKKWFVLLQLR
jgi:Uncharacterized protein conserved in bacteria (DUF2272)